MIIDNTQKVNMKMYRGDSMSFIFEIEDNDRELNSAYFTCKNNADDEIPLFQKSLTNGISKLDSGKYIVYIAPTDTNMIEAGKYPYDLQISIDDEVYTLIKGYLEVEFDVTNGGEH